MKYEIRNDSTQVTYEAEDLSQKGKAEREQSGGDTVVCREDGICQGINWSPVVCKPA